jgi:23S rRNA (uracil-5-)-methyltransferase RumA
MKKGEVLILQVEEMDFKGNGIAFHEERPIKIKGGVIGQKVEVKIRKRKRELEGEIVRVVERSALEVESLCPHFGDCGGCTYQNLTYETQLMIKEKGVLKLLEKEGITDFEFLGIEASPKIYGYRNKMEYTFGKDKEGNKALGLHRKGKFYEIVMTDKCNIVDEDFKKVLSMTFDYALQKELPFYDKKTHEGYLRHLVVRKASKNNELLINIVTTTQMDHDFNELVERYKKAGFVANLVGILHTYNDSLSDAVICEKMEILYGRDYLIEELLGLKFKISPFSFFQTNSYGAERIYSTVRDFAGDVSGKVVFDLYCGTGTIGIIMAPVAKKVFGIEIVEEAVISARENSKLNDLDNIEFIAGDVSKMLKEINEKPDVVIVDPPRAGVNFRAIEDIIKLSPEKIIYVSCNPETFARDLRLFIDRGYSIRKIKLIDMFPHTYHVESVGLLQKG